VSTRTRPLHALISQVRIAYTIEADNEFEFQMAQDGDLAARLSAEAMFLRPDSGGSPLIALSPPPGTHGQANSPRPLAAEPLASLRSNAFETCSFRPKPCAIPTYCGTIRCGT
jgi:hypothetical protein